MAAKKQSSQLKIFIRLIPEADNSPASLSQRKHNIAVLKCISGRKAKLNACGFETKVVAIPPAAMAGLREKLVEIGIKALPSMAVNNQIITGVRSIISTAEKLASVYNAPLVDMDDSDGDPINRFYNKEMDFDRAKDDDGDERGVGDEADAGDMMDRYRAAAARRDAQAKTRPGGGAAGAGAGGRGGRGTRPGRGGRGGGPKPRTRPSAPQPRPPARMSLSHDDDVGTFPAPATHHDGGDDDDGAGQDEITAHIDAMSSPAPVSSDTIHRAFSSHDGDDGDDDGGGGGNANDDKMAQAYWENQEAST